MSTSNSQPKSTAAHRSTSGNHWRLLQCGAAPVLALILLAGAAHSLQSRKPVEATDYFDRVKAASRNLPKVIGEWYGTEVPVAAPAIKILKPNFLISRRYQNLRTGSSVQVLVVQSLDPYDMVYHYPPNCFRHNGWTKEWSQQRQWNAGEAVIGAMEYGFHRARFTSDENVVVVNFVILASGLALDMKAIEEVAHDPMRRPYGAAQVQMIFDASVTEEDRRQVFDEIMAQYQPLLKEMVTRQPAAAIASDQAARSDVNVSPTITTLNLPR